MISIFEESKPFKDVNGFILQEIPDATLREQIGTEITYSLKYEQRPRLERLFKQLESNKERLGIGNYGISDTTLEEVSTMKYSSRSIEKKSFCSSGFPLGDRIS